MSNYTETNKSRNSLHRIARHDEQEFSKDSLVNVMERFVKTVSVMDETIMVPCRLMDRQIGDSTDIIAKSSKNVTTANQRTSSSKRNPMRSKNVSEFLNAAELFSLYNVLNAFKNDLLWTGSSDGGEDCDGSAEGGNVTAAVAVAASNIIANIAATATAGVEEPQTMATAATAMAATTTPAKGHARRISTASLASAASLGNISDTDSDVSNENDSGLECEAAGQQQQQQQQQQKNDAVSSSGSSSSSSSDDSIELHKSSSSSMNSAAAANADKAIELSRRCRRHLNGLYQCLEQMTEAAKYLTARYQSDIGPE